MDNVQKTSQTADPTLIKLLEADSALATQAATLASQMEALKEKRHSLQTVIGMFSSTGTSAAATDKIVTDIVETKRESVEPFEDATEEFDDETEPTQSFKTGRKSADAPQTEKSAGRDTAWRRYMRKEFAKTSLPEAVSHILHQQPDKIFEVPTIVDALFVDATPKDARNDARNRVSNVLSIGLKNNKWYRGKKGQYSLSQEAAKASVAS